MKNTERQILPYENRIELFRKSSNKENFENYKSDSKSLSDLKLYKNELIKYIDFVNETFRYTVILGAIIKVTQLFAV
jgi:hypothetical protein